MCAQNFLVQENKCERLKQPYLTTGQVAEAVCMIDGNSEKG